MQKGHMISFKPRRGLLFPYTSELQCHQWPDKSAPTTRHQRRWRPPAGLAPAQRTSPTQLRLWNAAPARCSHGTAPACAGQAGTSQLWTGLLALLHCRAQTPSWKSGAQKPSAISFTSVETEADWQFLLYFRRTNATNASKNIMVMQTK